MSIERELLKRAMDFMDDVFENERQNLRAHALAADIDAHLKAPVQSTKRQFFGVHPVVHETLQRECDRLTNELAHLKAPVQVIDASRQMSAQETADAFTAHVPVRTPSSSELSEEFERGRQAGITQCYDSALKVQDERKPLTRGLLIDLWAENIRDGAPDAVAFARAIEKAHGVRSDTDAVAAISQPAVPSGWVDVYERLPPEGVSVLATGIEYGYSSGKRWTEIGKRCTDGSWLTQDGHDELYRPTHWMPLPAAPDQV